MKKVLLVLVTVALLTSCGKSLRSAGGEVTGVRSVAFNEPAPYGMVLVKRGSFEMGPADKDSLWGIMPETKGGSFDAFWMDQTEVTNAKYRQFAGNTNSPKVTFEGTNYDTMKPSYLR